MCVTCVGALRGRGGPAHLARLEVVVVRNPLRRPGLLPYPCGHAGTQEVGVMANGALCIGSGGVPASSGALGSGASTCPSCPSCPSCTACASRTVWTGCASTGLSGACDTERTVSLIAVRGEDAQWERTRASRNTDSIEVENTRRRRDQNVVGGWWVLWVVGGEW